MWVAKLVLLVGSDSVQTHLYALEHSHFLQQFFPHFTGTVMHFTQTPSVCLYYSIIDSVPLRFGTCQFPYPNDVSDWYWKNVGKWGFPIWWSTLWPKMTYQWHVPSWWILCPCNVDVLCRLVAIPLTRYPFSEIPKMALFWSPSHVKNVGLDFRHATLDARRLMPKLALKLDPRELNGLVIHG